jgi:hypothetical protein
MYKILFLENAMLLDIVAGPSPSDGTLDKECRVPAKQNNRIITTLESELAKPAPKPKKPSRDWRAEMDDLVKQTAKMKGGPAIQSSAFSLLRASAALAQAAVHNPEDLDELWALERRVRTNLSRLQTILSRSE